MTTGPIARPLPSVAVPLLNGRCTTGRPLSAIKPITEDVELKILGTSPPVVLSNWHSGSQTSDWFVGKNTCHLPSRRPAFHETASRQYTIGISPDDTRWLKPFRVTPRVKKILERSVIKVSSQAVAPGLYPIPPRGCNASRYIRYCVISPKIINSGYIAQDRT